MIKAIVLALLLSLLPALSVVQAGPRLREAPGYVRVDRPSLPITRSIDPDLAQGYGQRGYGGTARRRQEGRVIPPSAALRAALGYSPGSQGLGVRLLKDGRLMYAVKLKTGNRVHRVLVDAQTGQVVGE